MIYGTEVSNCMSKSDITTKAKQLLARRGAPNGPWYYVSRDWPRQMLFLVAYVAIPIALWHLNLTMLAVASACFFAGSKIRDLRWWVALSREWPIASQLLDWPKIETIANGSANQ